MDLSKTIKNLEKNNMRVITADNRTQALQELKKLLPLGGTVTHGGSMTLAEVGVPELLKNGDYQYLDRTAVPDPREVYIKGYDADVFLTSANAVTENGELYNVDGNCNRISAISFGPKKVIVLVGKNKIVPTLEDAVIRVKRIAAPKNGVRLGCNTYCAKFGKCVSLSKENSTMTDGCASADRMCRNYLISGPQRDPGRVTVILINEDLGY